jgi:hypothetical protein
MMGTMVMHRLPVRRRMYSSGTDRNPIRYIVHGMNVRPELSFHRSDAATRSQGQSDEPEMFAIGTKRTRKACTK